MDLVQVAVVSFIKVIVRGEGGNYFLRLGDWGPFGVRILTYIEEKNVNDDDVKRNRGKSFDIF